MTQTLDIERELTPDEISERGTLRDKLDEERDGLLVAVEDRRREIRAFNVKKKRIEAQLRDVRRELRSGTVFEAPPSPQAIFPFEEPPPAAPARHGEGELIDPIELRHLITCVRPREFWPSVKEVSRWHAEVRADVQKWCRAEHTRAHPIAGHPLPDTFMIPNVLENIRFRVEEKNERKRKASKVGKRKAAARKASKRARS
jgi:hypothetical protein